MESLKRRRMAEMKIKKIRKPNPTPQTISSTLQNHLAEPLVDFSHIDSNAGKSERRAAGGTWRVQAPPAAFMQFFLHA